MIEVCDIILLKLWLKCVMLCDIFTRLMWKIISHGRLFSSNNSRLPWKVICHWRSSFMKGQLSFKVVFHSIYLLLHVIFYGRNYPFKVIFYPRWHFSLESIHLNGVWQTSLYITSSVRFNLNGGNAACKIKVVGFAENKSN